VQKALRTLARLGFVRMEDEDHVRLGPALARFIEPVQRASDPKAAMATLISKGMVERDDDDEPSG
jgi:chromosome partition protein MukE